MSNWGSYRGNLYFGMRTRSPRSLLTGLIWYSIDPTGNPIIRHYCNLEDNIEVWGWKEHDGESFGFQTIIDKRLNLKLDISFELTSKDVWSALIEADAYDAFLPLQVSLIHYLAEERINSTLTFKQTNSTIDIAGYKDNRSQFDFSMNSQQNCHVHVLSTSYDHVWDASTLLVPLLKNEDQNHPNKDGNLIAVEYQVASKAKIQLDFHEGSLNERKCNRRKAFRRKFKKKFSNIPKSVEKVCRFALSNMLGSISYFYGTSYVLKEGYFDSCIDETPPFELFTDIPSRATFPRGFLWDSGFHNLVISEWNPMLSLDVLESWSHRIEHNGWVAREQVPGGEARRAVPIDYIVQNTKHANPPALLMTILKLAKKAESKNTTEHLQIIHRLHKIVPQFEKNIKWLIRTQRGQIHPHFCQRLSSSRSCNQVLKLPAFRWRGRSKYHNLNSGLDDYPRGDFANKYELHVDLACWVAFGADAMLKLYDLLDVKGNVKWTRKFAKIKRHVLYSLDHIHWDEHRQIYSDVTISTTGDLMYAQHQGYVNLFPLIFGFIDKNSDKLKSSLDLIEDEARLWTPFGLRSLSKNDPYYMKGDQYWTGPIWININYLVLAALKNHYMDPQGKNYTQASRIYNSLRDNIINNMSSSFAETNMIWEQYSDVNGKGMRSRPFTGWSSLLLLIAAELY